MKNGKSFKIQKCSLSLALDLLFHCFKAYHQESEKKSSERKKVLPSLLSFTLIRLENRAFMKLLTDCEKLGVQIT